MRRRCYLQPWPCPARIWAVQFSSALTAFVLVEKIGPAGAAIARVAGASMMVAGILLIAASV